MTDLLRKTKIEVAARGELVVLTLGNLDFSIEFPLALALAASMRYHAAIAKANAGHEGRGLHVFGVLTDASAPAMRRRRFANSLPELLNPRGLDVRADGALVVVTIGRTTARLPYKTARIISQWIRVRGKEAKTSAGEPAHWSKIGRVQEAISGQRAW